MRIELVSSTILPIADVPRDPRTSSRGKRGLNDVPHGGAVLRGLAEEEAHLLEGLCESVAGRHLCVELGGETSREDEEGGSIRLKLSVMEVQVPNVAVQLAMDLHKL